MDRNRITTLVILGMATVMLLAGCSGGGGPIAPTIYSVSGQVVDSNNIGIKGVSVIYTGTVSGTATTSDNGDWMIPVLKGTTTIEPRKSGWVFDPVNRVVTGATSGIKFSGSRVDHGLVVETSGEGWVERTPDKTEYAYGESVELRAKPAVGWRFSHWEGDLTGSTNPTTVVVGDLTSIRAVFIMSIQAAIDNAVDGDVITVPPGTYRERIDFKGKSITVRSKDPNDASIVGSTIIDGGSGGPVVTFSGGEDANATLKGFTIVHGTGKYVDGTYRGGGIFVENSSPTIAYNVVTNNQAYEGAGICVIGTSSPLIVGNTIGSNVSANYHYAVWANGIEIVMTNNRIINNSGHGLYVNSAEASISGNVVDGNGGIGILAKNSKAKVEDFVVEANTIINNGGNGICIPSDTSATINGNVIRNNKIGIDAYCPHELIIAGNELSDNTIISSTGFGSVGAAICISDADNCVTIQDNEIRRHYATSGGAVYASTAELGTISILRNTFEGNSATCGGAVSIESNYDPAILIDRNTFTDNEAEMGGAVYIDTGRFCSMSISNNTFTDNEANRGGAIYADWTKISSLNHNTFFRNAADYNGGAIYLAGLYSTIDSEFSNVYGYNTPNNIYSE